MTKQELINALTELPGDAQVLLQSNDGLWAVATVKQFGPTSLSPSGHAILTPGDDEVEVEE